MAKRYINDLKGFSGVVYFREGIDYSSGQYNGTGSGYFKTREGIGDDSLWGWDYGRLLKATVVDGWLDEPQVAD